MMEPTGLTSRSCKTEMQQHKQQAPEHIDSNEHLLREAVISAATYADVDGITELLSTCRLGIPVFKELGGIHIVARHGQKIVGYVWALIGNGRIAYLDFLAVHPDYRSSTASTSPYKLALRLCEGARSILESNFNVNQYICVCPPYLKDMKRIYKQIGLVEDLGKYNVLRKLS